MTDRENVAILIDAWKLMVGRMPRGEIRQADGVATMFAHIPMPFLNLSALDRPLPEREGFQAALEVAKGRAGECKHASILCFCESWVPGDWRQLAADAGFTLALNMTGMVADRLLEPRRPAPPLEFQRVGDDAAARDLAMINAAAYGMPPELFEEMCNTHIWRADIFAYIGYAEGRAVTCAAALPLAGTMYIAFVATQPDVHGKGYAEAAMRKAIQQAQHAMGEIRMTLHASDAGRPLYQSMGFRPGASVPVLAPTNGAAAGK